MGVADVIWIAVLALIGAGSVRISLRLFGTVVSPLGGDTQRARIRGPILERPVAPEGRGVRR